MKQTRLIMGMPITVEIVDSTAAEKMFEAVFAYFEHIDQTFSTYKKESEISLVNAGMLRTNEYSLEMQTVLELSEKTKMETQGYFNILSPNGLLDPSGLVKGWAIYNAAQMLETRGFKNFYIEAGGDIQAQGRNEEGNAWKIGIQNPFSKKEIIKVVYLQNKGIATSGTYVRGQHIWNPFNKFSPITDIVSVTIIAKNVYEADRFATAAFAMGKEGIRFIETKPELEGYAVDARGIATMTSGFEALCTP